MGINASNSSSKIFRIIIGVFLFCYFGFAIFPEWSRPWSAQFMVWLALLPIVVIVLVVTGIRGGVGLWREKVRRTLPNPQNKYFLWVASLGILWFLISLAFAGPNYSAYFKFDSEKWKSADWDKVNLFEFSPRERMLDDLMKNVLPGRTEAEIIKLLGPPDQVYIKGPGTIFYYIGWNIMEPKCLFMKFDEQGIIKEYNLTTCG